MSWRNAARRTLPLRNSSSWTVWSLLPSPEQEERTGSKLKWPRGHARTLLRNPGRFCSLCEEGHCFLLILYCWLAGEALPRPRCCSGKSGRLLSRAQQGRWWRRFPSRSGSFLQRLRFQPVKRCFLGHLKERDSGRGSEPSHPPWRPLWKRPLDSDQR